MIISIRNLRATTLLGVYPEERLAPRELVLNLTIEYDHRDALRSDSVSDVPDYAVIEQAIVDLLATQTFHLLEPLAQKVAECVLGIARVERVTVEIDKPGALRYSQMVSVRHTLSND